MIAEVYQEELAITYANGDTHCLAGWLTKKAGRWEGSGWGRASQDHHLRPRSTLERGVGGKVAEAAAADAPAASWTQDSGSPARVCHLEIAGHHDTS